MPNLQKCLCFLVVIVGLGCFVVRRASAQSPGDLFPDASAQPHSHAPSTPAANPAQPPATAPAAPAVRPAPAPPVPIERLPAPDPAAIKAAMAIVNDAYQLDMNNAKTPEQKTAMATKLIGAAGDEKDPPSRFALLSKARDVATDAGDFDTASAAIDALDTGFVIDRVSMESQAAMAIGRTSRILDQQRALGAALPPVIDAAIAADRYDIAQTLAELMLGSANRTDDAAMARQAAIQIQHVRDAHTAFVALKPSFAVLADNPKDPDANFQVGKFRCFIKAEWDTGLPMLARGSDAALKTRATSELQKPADASAQSALADGWWDLADKETGITKANLQSHAGVWYALAAPNLTGLQKTKADERLQIIAAAEPPTTIDLFKLIDLARDSAGGAWTFQNGTLASDSSKYARMEFPYQPPAEYDYRIVFARTGGNNTVTFICSAGGHQFVAVIGAEKNELVGFELIGGKPIVNGRVVTRNIATVRSTAWLENGRRYTCLIKVRKDRVMLYLDGQPITSWNTNYSDLSIPSTWQLHDGTSVGLGSFDSPTTFYSAQIIEITGHGKEVK